MHPALMEACWSWCCRRCGCTRGVGCLGPWRAGMASVLTPAHGVANPGSRFAKPQSCAMSREARVMGHVPCAMNHESRVAESGTPE